MAIIKPGEMGPKSDTGKPAKFADSIAEAMENAFNDTLSADSMRTFEVDTNSTDARDRRRMFVAIATGMMQYLKHNMNGFEILDALNHPTGEKIVMNTDPGGL
jgi:hypothetical protein